MYLKSKYLIIHTYFTVNWSIFIKKNISIAISLGIMLIFKVTWTYEENVIVAKVGIALFILTARTLTLSMYSIHCKTFIKPMFYARNITTTKKHLHNQSLSRETYGQNQNCFWETLTSPKNINPTKLSLTRLTTFSKHKSADITICYLTRGGFFGVKRHVDLYLYSIENAHLLTDKHLL